MYSVLLLSSIGGNVQCGTEMIPASIFHYPPEKVSLTSEGGLDRERRKIRHVPAPEATRSGLNVKANLTKPEFPN